jgi:uncharacterized protein YkwD
MKELSLALTLILTGLGMSQSKQFNPVPHAPAVAAVEAITAGTDNPAPQATVATVAPADDQAVALLATDDGEANASADEAAQADDRNAAGLLVTRQSRGSTGAPSPDDYRPTLAEQMLAENNRVRALAGKPPQTLDQRLCQAAQEQADHLARNNYRYTSSGSAHFYGNGSVETRAARYGFQGDLGENFAGNQHDLETAFEQWQESPGHARTLYGSYDRCGFGMAYSPTTGHTYWMAVYGREGPAFTAQPVKLQPRQSQPVYRQPQQTYRSYSQCGPGGCGPSGFRPVRRFRGR